MLWLTPRERATLWVLGVAAILGIAANAFRAAQHRVTITVAHPSPPAQPVAAR